MTARPEPTPEPEPAPEPFRYVPAFVPGVCSAPLMSTVEGVRELALQLKLAADRAALDGRAFVVEPEHVAVFAEHMGNVCHFLRTRTV